MGVERDGVDAGPGHARARTASPGKSKPAFDSLGVIRV